MGEPIGFVGLGIMGEPMATRLARAGLPLVVWNRSERAARALADVGAEVAPDPRTVFARARIVILMLANADAIDAVLRAPGAGLGDLVAGRIVVNMGTIAPAVSQRLAADVAAAGGVLVEAPVSGSRRPAEEGALVGMLAGPEDAVAEVAPILEHLCASITVCGAVPAALTMKLSVNVFLIALVTGLAESFHFAEQHGLPLATLRQVLDAGQMASPISRVKTEKVVGEDWAPQASIRDVLMNADLIVDAAREAGIASPLLDVARALYAESVAQGDGALDMVAVLHAITARTVAAGDADADAEVRIRPAQGPSEHPALVAVWRSAVDATHDFLAREDRDAIEAALADAYLPAVHLAVAEVGGRVVGFAGMHDGALEMLFVDAAHHGRGVGSALLAHAIAEHGIRRVDVNEQNASAARFYERRGFEVAGRSETDDAGRPYPILHLRLGSGGV
ncbi:acetyltransferase [Agrococcus sp. SGAir0287]|uniref:acetyltransferase n=1 Tax=Agrococcus sp. SGAir0287 TaxID=2070347 RepID=UPI0010CD12F1|nr:acetyltransferase [Agrococcus sp. SGAir0287]